MLRTALPMLALLLTAGCTMTAAETAREDASNAQDQARLEKRLAGYVPGQPQSCISQTRNYDMTIYGDTLVYRNGGTLYRTQTNGGCFGLRRDDIVVTRSIGTQLCRGDIVRTVDRTSAFPTGACSFGDFVPYTRPRRG